MNWLPAGEFGRWKYLGDTFQIRLAVVHRVVHLSIIRTDQCSVAQHLFGPSFGQLRESFGTGALAGVPSQSNDRFGLPARRVAWIQQNLEPVENYLPHVVKWEHQFLIESSRLQTILKGGD